MLKEIPRLLRADQPILLVKVRPPSLLIHPELVTERLPVAIPSVGRHQIAEQALHLG